MLKETPQFLVVDDDAIVRSAVELMISHTFPGARIAMCGDLAEGLSHLDAQWDLMVVDLCLGDASGLALIKACADRNISTPVLIMSSRVDKEAALPAFKAGARGFICKDNVIESLGDAIQQILSGQRYISDELAEQLLETTVDSSAPALSAQESTLLMHIGSGRSVKESAALMGISEKTVRTYRQRLCEKLHLQSDAELIRYAIKNGMVD